MRQVETKPQKSLIYQVNAPEKIKELLDYFISEADVKESSKQSYTRNLKLFFDWTNKRFLRLNELTRSDVLSYKSDLINSGLSSLTVSTYLSAVRLFYQWAEGHKLYPNIASGVKSPKKKQQFRKQSLTKEQSHLLLNFCKENSKRDYAIVCLLLGCGLRTIEAIRANVEDLTIRAGKRIINVHGKGRDDKNDFVKVPENVFNAIQEYLANRSNLKTSEPLFISNSNHNKGKRLTTRSISRIAKTSLRAIGLNDRSITAHSLRHTCAVTLLSSGMSLQDAQGVLRHQNVNTTQIYIASIQEDLMLKNNTETILNSLFC